MLRGPIIWTPPKISTHAQKAEKTSVGTLVLSHRQEDVIKENLQITMAELSFPHIQYCNKSDESVVGLFFFQMLFCFLCPFYEATRELP